MISEKNRPRVPEVPRVPDRPSEQGTHNHNQYEKVGRQKRVKTTLGNRDATLVPWFFFRVHINMA